MTAGTRDGGTPPVVGFEDAALARRLRAAGCVFAEDEARVLLEAAGPDTGRLEELTARRLAGEPLEWVVGWAQFHGLRIGLGPGVFVPRARSAHLVDVALTLPGAHHLVVDMCCGSGALGAALVEAWPQAELWACDLDPVAVRCAQRNLRGIGTATCGDLFDALPGRLRGRIDVLVANTPYVPGDRIATMPPEARDHEPRLALDGGADGLAVQRRLARQAPAWLAPGGRLLVEASPGQASRAAGILSRAHLRPRVIRGPGGGCAVVGLARRERPGPGRLGSGQ